MGSTSLIINLLILHDIRLTLTNIILQRKSTTSNLKPYGGNLHQVSSFSCLESSQLATGDSYGCHMGACTVCNDEKENSPP
ncbi:hypothetical protein BDV23DRAFT_161124 [Aspergillus alliaceus]|uniref:Uncharacterized protein n=1 Tax=Petromyces alliaceus TaxID=209559 RepID=A0A5N7C0L5_PETAA|nr:hypothetical protein BDV23DRAFT_161124 [Aspergillus alliaceus]